MEIAGKAEILASVQQDYLNPAFHDWSSTAVLLSSCDSHALAPHLVVFICTHHKLDYPSTHCFTPPI